MKDHIGLNIGMAISMSYMHLRKHGLSQLLQIIILAAV